MHVAADSVDRDSVDGDAIDAAVAQLGDLARRDVPLGPMTTYRVGGAADVFVRPRHVDDLHRVSAALDASDLAVLVVGRGSNLLVADSGFRGVALTLADLAGHGVDHIAVDRATSVVRASGAVLLPVLARRLAALDLVGFEWAVGVPGSVGGAVRMNAGGHGSDMSASLIDVTTFDLVTSTVRTLDASELGLRFRGSDLAPTTVVLDARLRLAPGDGAAAKRELAEIVAWRRANQPGGQNAGSVFVNPVPGEVSAGSLIDSVGLRGFRLGSATVSHKHANFIQADESGTAGDVRELMRTVSDRVERDTGYALRSEIRLVGFDDDAEDAE